MADKKYLEKEMKKLLNEAEPDRKSNHNLTTIIGTAVVVFAIIAVIVALQLNAASREAQVMIAKPDQPEIIPAVSIDTPNVILQKNRSEEGTSFDLLFFTGCSHRPRVKQNQTFNANDSDRKNVLENI